LESIGFRVKREHQIPALSESIRLARESEQERSSRGRGVLENLFNTSRLWGKHRHDSNAPR